MKKNYQTTVQRARITPNELTVHAERAPADATIRGLPDSVRVAIADLAGEFEEGLLAFAVGTGLKVLDLILEFELLSKHRFTTKAEARRAVAGYIDRYNRTLENRLHSSCEMMSPNAYEAILAERVAAEKATAA